jgi:two-component system OmpR family response regulator
MLETLPKGRGSMEERSILLVDDEPAYHLIISALLKDVGISVQGVPDAASAFQAIRGHRFSLILLDIQMAGIDGFRGVGHIRSASDWTRNVPIVAFTASNPADDESAFVQRGFDGLLAKPFCAADLVHLLRCRLQDESIGRTMAKDPMALSDIVGSKTADVMLKRFHARHVRAQRRLSIAAIWQFFRMAYRACAVG